MFRRGGSHNITNFTAKLSNCLVITREASFVEFSLFLPGTSAGTASTASLTRAYKSSNVRSILMGIFYMGSRFQTNFPGV